MWPMRGPKASQKDPMAIREKHVPECIQTEILSVSRNNIECNWHSTGNRVWCRSSHMRMPRSSDLSRHEPVMDAMAAPLASVPVRLMSSRMTAWAAEVRVDDTSQHLHLR